MKNKTIYGILIIFLLFFFVLLFAEYFGYYESKEIRANRLTEEQIKKFEEDVANGKEVDINKYVINESIDYSNDLSNKIYKVSLKLEGLVDKAVKLIFNTSEKMVSD